MASPIRLRPLTALIVVSTLLSISCSPPPPPKPTVIDLLKQGPLRDSFYACLLNGLAQHLPLQQIQKDCETKLTFNGTGGLNRTPPDVSLAGHNQAAFDPATLQATCNSGNPGRGAGNANTVGTGTVQGTTVHGNTYVFGYTFGGKGQTSGYVTNEHGEVGVGVYKGLSKEQAEKETQTAVDDYLKALKEYDDLVTKQKAELEAQGKDPGDWEKDSKMAAERRAAEKKWFDAWKKAKEDPNLGMGGITLPSPSNQCQDALQEAREIIGECQMTGWKSAGCQSLQARLQGCPDPSLIYVDPEQGYSCRPTIDPEALKQAWTERCEQLKRPTPGGPNPCGPPEIDPNSRFITANDGNSTCGGPQVYVSPDVEPDRSCVHTLNLPSFEQSTHQIYVWGLNNLGGPIVVFGPRNNPPPPTPGPQPRPVP